MIKGQRKMAPQSGEVLMLVPEVIRQIRQLREVGWGAKRIAGQLGVARGTVRRYMRATGEGEVLSDNYISPSATTTPPRPERRR
jgi:hypothetical protein